MAKRSLIAYEDTNMYGGAHCTNYATAKRAMEEGRPLLIKRDHYDGQRYHSGQYHVYDLHEEDGNIVGTDEDGERWEATKELCEFARTGRIY